MIAAFSAADQLRRRPAPVNNSMRRTGSGICLCSEINMCRSPHPLRQSPFPRHAERCSADTAYDLDTMIVAIVDELAPALVARNSIGHGSAAQLLLTAGDNAERLQSEASFAALCGVSPVPASSGKTIRHRLNRGGDRAANSALHIIAIGRLRTDPRTKAYLAKRLAEGHSKLEAIRCLKRYIARELFALIKQRRREINQAAIAA